MIPILYDAGTTTFTTQGLGRLSSATSCQVTEVLGGVYELEMGYPIDGAHYDDLALSRIIYTVPADGANPQPFRIYRISRPMDGLCTISAEHISYQLSCIPVMPFTARTFREALAGLVTNAAETCPFSVWTDITESGSFSFSVPSSFSSLIGGALTEAFGEAEYEFDGYIVKAHSERGSNNGVKILYGKNLTDLRQEENIQNTITGICPYWYNDSDKELVTIPAKVVHASNYVNYPYARTIPVDLSSEFEEAPTQAELLAAAQAYIADNNIGVPEVSLTVSFVSLWQSEEYAGLVNEEQINMGDTITVEFEKLGVSATAKVVKTVFDCLHERYTSIEIGTPKSTLASTLVGVSNKTELEYLQSSVSSLLSSVNGIDTSLTAVISANYTATTISWLDYAASLYDYGWGTGYYDSQTGVQNDSNDYICTNPSLYVGVSGATLLFVSAPAGYIVYASEYDSTGVFIAQHGGANNVKVAFTAGHQFRFDMGVFSNNSYEYLDQDFLDSIVATFYVPN